MFLSLEECRFTPGIAWNLIKFTLELVPFSNSAKAFACYKSSFNPSHIIYSTDNLR